MQKRNLFVVLAINLLVVLPACAEPEPEMVEVTREVEVPQTVEVAREVTREVTTIVEKVVTQEVQVTRLVTAEPTPTPTVKASAEKFAANYVAAQEQGGVIIELTRVLCISRQLFQEERGISDQDLETRLGDAATVCEFVLTVENSADDVRNIYPDEGDVVIGNEQIDLARRSVSIPDVEEVSGELQPGIVRIGGFWFGVKRSEVDEVDQMTYIIDPPSDADYSRRGSEFRFEFSAEGWGFEPLPEDL